MAAEATALNLRLLRGATVGGRPGGGSGSAPARPRPDVAPHLATLAVITLAIGWLMAMAGLQKSALEFKKRHRVCPSCGRRIEARTCTSCV